MKAEDQAVMGRWAELGQGHLFAHWKARSTRRRRRLLADLAVLQPACLAELVEALRAGPSAAGAAVDLQPVAALRREQWQEDPEALERGEQLLAEGRAGFLTVAGGQGSRLGFRGPKGCFPISVLRRASLFQVFAEKLLACRRRYGRPLTWLIMVSPLNLETTRGFFQEREFFGIPEQEVTFFCQSMYPTLDPEGRLLLAENGGLLRNPDGHGGVIEALRGGGLIGRIAGRGVQELFYFQVDNPLVRVPDPPFLGKHSLADSEMSSKVVAKAYPEEKLGSIGSIDGRPGIIEYSDLDTARKHARDAQGRLLYSHGSIAVHIINASFVADRALQLPLHVARKAVRTLVPAPDGGSVQEMEALKFEKFIFDAVPRARRPLFCETAREEEFAPLKNRHGADSIATCRRGMEEQHARWLESAGLEVPRRRGRLLHHVEISPLYAEDAAALKGRLKSSVNRIDEDTLLV